MVKRVLQFASGSTHLKKSVLIPLIFPHKSLLKKLECWKNFKARRRLVDDCQGRKLVLRHAISNSSNSKTSDQLIY